MYIALNALICPIGDALNADLVLFWKMEIALDLVPNPILISV
jgi:hypothetical protein